MSFEVFDEKSSYLNNARKQFEEKNKVLESRYGKPWKAKDVYEYVFGDNIQDKGNPVQDKYNGILVYSEKNKEGKNVFRREMYFKGSEMLLKRSRMPFLITNGVLYAGKKNKAENARLMCAMIIDLDGVDSVKRLEMLLHRFEMELNIPGQPNHITKPTFLINSGTGFHIYYVFDKPIPLYPSVRRKLMEFKRQLTRHLWVVGITDKTGENEVQYQPITQGFRAVGSCTKIGKDYKVTAFKLADRYPIEYWKEWIERQSRAYRNNDLVPITIDYVSKLSIEKAKELYPEWYERKVLNKEKKSHYIVKRDLYEWYKRELLEKEDSVEGKRYYRIMCLAIYAKKCGVSREELERDALEYKDKLNRNYHTHEFTNEDVHAALEMYNDNYYTFPRKSIVNLTGYDIKESKRNFRKRKEHLKGARAVQEVFNPDWRKNNGRKSKNYFLDEYKLKFEDGSLDKITSLSTKNITPKEISDNTKISRKTVIKHLKMNGTETARIVKRGRSSKELEVVKLIKKNPGKTITELSNISGINRKTIAKYKK